MDRYKKKSKLNICKYVPYLLLIKSIQVTVRYFLSQKSLMDSKLSLKSWKGGLLNFTISFPNNSV